MRGATRQAGMGNSHIANAIDEGGAQGDGSAKPKSKKSEIGRCKEGGATKNVANKQRTRKERARPYVLFRLALPRSFSLQSGR